MKVILGPVFKAIEERVFSLDWFIKKVPVHLRPDYVMRRMYREGAKYYSTDYTAFESLFTKEVMENCEFVLYDYMLQHHPQGDEYKALIHDVLSGKNHCQFKYFTVDVEATRMSGEMNTSLGNGFSNLMFMLFLAEENGCTDVTGVVEGDDGLFTMKGKCPTTKDFEKLGLVIKMEEHDSISTASFCGIVHSEEDRSILTNPIDLILNFGYASGRYAGANKRTILKLLRAKSLSMIYQYPGCPMVNTLALYGLKMTHNINIKSLLSGNHFDEWEKSKLIQAVNFYENNKKHIDTIVTTTTSSRLLVEKLYGIPIETQVAFENYIEGLETLQMIRFDRLLPYCHLDQIDYFWRFRNFGGEVNRPEIDATRGTYAFKHKVNLGPIMA